MRNASARTHTHTHTHTHTQSERTNHSRLAFAVTRFRRPMVRNGQERKKRHQNCTTTTNPFRLVVFIAFGVKSAISLSSSEHKLEQNFLWVSASCLRPACNEQVVCPNSRRNRPRSGLRIFGLHVIHHNPPWKGHGPRSKQSPRRLRCSPEAAREHL